VVLVNDDSCVPSVLDNLPLVRQSIGHRTPVFFLDYDGTLAPIAARPELADMDPEMRRALEALARDYVVCVASGRGLTDLLQKVGMHNVYYAADHGYRVLGPEGSGIDFEVAPDGRQELEEASYELERRLQNIPGVLIETKEVSITVHYRQVADPDRALVKHVVDEIAESAPGLRVAGGKLVYELLPEAGWDKGRAMLWVLRRLRLGRRDSCPICLGDDLTDEDMFRAARGWGVSVVVGCPSAATQADFSLKDWVEVAAFLGAFGGGLRYPRAGRG
jgi:trehalose 6-phosphate phosphatase